MFVLPLLTVAASGKGTESSRYWRRPLIGPLLLVLASLVSVYFVGAVPRAAGAAGSVVVSRGAIVFVSQRVVGEGDEAHTAEISRTVNADGSGDRRLRFSTRRSDWAWSPDASRIAYRGRDGMYVMNADGTARRRVAPGRAFNYSWSPDGRRLAYDSGGFPASIYVVDIARGTVNRVATGLDVTWSPRADKLAFLEDRTGSGQLVVTSADGSGRQLISAGVFAPPRWSPDGTRIAFVKEEGGIGGDAYLHVARADGQDVSPLTPKRGRFQLFKYSADFDWSPRGDRIVYHALNARDEALVVPAGGRGFRSIAQGLSHHTDAGPPTWSPTGNRIVFVKAATGEIWVMNADGSGKKRLTRAGDFAGVDLEPRWEPRGRRAGHLPG